MNGEYPDSLFETFLMHHQKIFSTKGALLLLRFEYTKGVLLHSKRRCVGVRMLVQRLASSLRSFRLCSDSSAIGREGYRTKLFHLFPILFRYRENLYKNAICFYIYFSIILGVYIELQINSMGKTIIMVI